MVPKYIVKAIQPLHVYYNFVRIKIIVFILPVAFGYSLSSEAVVKRQLRR